MFEEIKYSKFNFGKILSTSWKIYSSSFKTILFVCLIIYLPANLILNNFLAHSNAQGFDLVREQTNINRILGIIYLLATIAIIAITESALNNKNIGLGESFSVARKNWWSAIWTNWFAGIIIVLLALLLIVPGVIWAVYYSFTTYIVVLKNLRGKQALDYSKELVKGQWWRVLGILLLLFIIEAVLVLGISFINPFGITAVLAGTIFDTAGDIISAFFVVATTIFFLNLDHLKHPVVLDNIGDMEITL